MSDTALQQRPNSSGSVILPGLLPAIGAYGIWSLFPLYFALLHAVSPFEVVGWRLMCTLPICLVAVAALRQGAALRAALTDRRLLGALTLSGFLIGANWLIYILAVMHGHVLAASLGYYINPLVNVLAATIFLKEKLTGRQWIAVALAAIGVALLAKGALDTLWLSMALALTFAAYGLTRKLAPVDPLPGLTIETIVLFVPALGLMGWQLQRPEGLVMGSAPGISLLLLCTGPLTAIPLMLFASAARKLPFSILGFVQFLTPTVLFLISVFVFDEPIKPVHFVCFGFIWTAIAVFCWDIVSRRAAR
ncbi:EamA family transporter RarD [Novosphingobium resinovorum]|uniref:EamA family transporter RarD n=1 Tax=Novosphingobium resinovorum TaxID=158500 RepID=UPI002ED2D6C2|nr:EamA family transporter RarD [Novosphingobium resinovorum]